MAKKLSKAARAILAVAGQLPAPARAAKPARGIIIGESLRMTDAILRVDHEGWRRTGEARWTSPAGEDVRYVARPEGMQGLAPNVTIYFCDRWYKNPDHRFFAQFALQLEACGRNKIIAIGGTRP